MNEQAIKKAIEGDRDYLVSLRRHFHQNPELPRKEFKTAQRIEAELMTMGLEPRRVAETGVYCEIHGKLEVSADGHAPRTIVLRADMDALPVVEEHDCPYKSQTPGVMHACGHDAHTAALLGAARYLSSHTEEFCGTIRLNFQPAEEIGYGAQQFINAGLVKGADRTFGEHLESRIPCGKVSVTSGPNNASVDWFRITVNGHQAHVSTPNRGIDALYIASQIVVSAQAAVTRLTDPTDSVLIGIGTLNAGSAYNVVAKQAVMEGTIRAMLPKTRAKAIADLERIAKDTAHCFGGEVGFEWGDFTSPLINDRQSCRESAMVATRLFGEDNVITDRPYSLGGDDFAEYIIACPGVYAYVGSGNANIPETTVAHHDSHFDIDENCLTVAASLYAAYAENFLNGTTDKA